MLILRPATSYGQTESYRNKDSVLHYFLRRPDVTSHFISPKDSVITIVDVDKALARIQLQQFGGLPVSLDTSSLVIDTIKKEGVFSIRNRQKNYLILLGGKRGNNRFISVYNPVTNADCVISFFIRNKMYRIRKLSCGWF